MTTQKGFAAEFETQLWHPSTGGCRDILGDHSLCGLAKLPENSLIHLSFTSFTSTLYIFRPSLGRNQPRPPQHCLTFEQSVLSGEKSMCRPVYQGIGGLSNPRLLRFHNPHPYPCKPLFRAWALNNKIVDGLARH